MFTSPTDKVALGASAAGVVLVVAGSILQDGSGAGIGGTVRALGGVLLLGGLGAFVLGEPRRRAATLGALRGIGARYKARTAGWNLADRVGVAGALLGLATIVLGIAASFIFGIDFGLGILGVVVFMSGAGLVLGVRLHRCLCSDDGSYTYTGGTRSMRSSRSFRGRFRGGGWSGRRGGGRGR